MKMESFTHMSCKCLRLIETIFCSSEIAPVYLQYGKELLASWSRHTLLTGLPGPDPSPIGHPWYILGLRIHDCIPLQLPHFPNLNTSWLNNGNVFHERVGYNPRLLISKCKNLIECIYKRWRSYMIWPTMYKLIIIGCSYVCIYFQQTW